MKITEMRKQLESHGIFVGKRDPKRNTRFSGQYMICENLDEGPSEDARNGGYCIVGHNLAALIEDAYSHFESHFEHFLENL